MGADPADGVEPDEVFDHELTRVLQEHGQVLEEHSRDLLTTGTTSIAMPGVILRARLRVPRRWRQGLLEITAEDPASGEVIGTSSSPLSRGRYERESLSLIEEITINLALTFVYGPASAGPPQERRDGI